MIEEYILSKIPNSNIPTKKENTHYNSKKISCLFIFLELLLLILFCYKLISLNLNKTNFQTFQCIITLFCTFEFFCGSITLCSMAKCKDAKQKKKKYTFTLFSCCCTIIVNYIYKFIINIINKNRSKKITKIFNNYKKNISKKNIYYIEIFKLCELYNNLFNEEEKLRVKNKIDELFKEYEKNIVDENFKELDIYKNCLSKI